jgi:hypothetical protein
MVKEALISTKVTAEVATRLKHLAGEDRRSLSNYVALILERHVRALSPFEMPVFPPPSEPARDPVNPSTLRVRKPDVVRKKHKAPP